MAKLTAKSRKKLPKKEFGEPSKRKYPMPDKKHAEAAKGRATQMEDKGKLSASEASKIKAKANKEINNSAKTRTRKRTHRVGK